MANVGNGATGLVAQKKTGEPIGSPVEEKEDDSARFELSLNAIIVFRRSSFWEWITSHNLKDELQTVLDGPAAAAELTVIQEKPAGNVRIRRAQGITVESLNGTQSEAALAMIECIEHLEAELEVLRLSDIGILEDR